MEEIRQREQKLWINARSKQEEGIKLKAIRNIRFGPFSIKVPALNITRHYDYPLPESTAKPEVNIVDTSTLNIKMSMPGQKHVGIMIPELYERKKPDIRTKYIRLQSIKDTEETSFRMGNIQNLISDTEDRSNPLSKQDKGFEVVVLNDCKNSAGSFCVKVLYTGI